MYIDGGFTDLHGSIIVDMYRYQELFDFFDRDKHVQCINVYINDISRNIYTCVYMYVIYACICVCVYTHTQTHTHTHTHTHTQDVV